MNSGCILVVNSKIDLTKFVIIERVVFEDKLKDNLFTKANFIIRQITYILFDLIVWSFSSTSCLCRNWHGGYLEDNDTANDFFSDLQGSGNKVYISIVLPFLTAVAHMYSPTPFTCYQEGVTYLTDINTAFNNQNDCTFGPSA